MLAALIVAALALTACATPIAGTASPVASADLPTTAATISSAGSTDAPGSSAEGTAGASPDTGSGPGSTTAAPAGPVIDPAAFGARMQAANAGIKTMRGSIAVTAGPLTEQGTFSETLSGGTASAIDMTLFVKSNGQRLPIKVLIVDHKVYLGGSEILSALKAGDKQWALASASSGNSNLRSLATQLDGLLESTSADQYRLFAEAAKSITDGGIAKLGRLDTHKYVITVDVAKLARLVTGRTKASMNAVLAAGVKTMPSTIWLDGSSGRIVQSTSDVAVGGVTSDTLFKVTGYNTPVVINAPAPAEVYTG